MGITTTTAGSGGSVPVTATSSLQIDRDDDDSLPVDVTAAFTTSDPLPFYPPFQWRAERTA